MKGNLIYISVDVKPYSLILWKIKHGNKTLSKIKDSKNAKIDQSIAGLETMFDGVSTRNAEAEEHISTAEDKLVELDSIVLKLCKENNFLLQKIDQLENHSRCNNIWVINLWEGNAGTDPVRFFTYWIPSTFLWDPDYWMGASVPHTMASPRSEANTGAYSPAEVPRQG